MKLTLIENFRALFYAPFYAAAELGAWRAEGLEIGMITPKTSAETIQILATGGAEVSWGGPMRLMIALDKDPESDSVAFCEVVGRDPFFVLGRTPNPGFTMQHLVGPRVATVSEVPTPWICLQRDLVLAGIDPKQVARAPERTMAENVAALRAGEVDVIQVFQPFAQAAIDEGIGHVWYRASDRGLACYTTLNTTRAFIRSHPDTVLGVTRAMYRTQKWIAAHSGAELAGVVSGYLPEVPRDVLATCFDGYKATGVWSADPIVQRTGLDWKRDAMLSCGAISRSGAYEDYVDLQFAERIVREDPPSI
ncbi:MAG: ABC transporter substrate-binding protein [bacterium]|jgi:NitT/TauT family transport system substrate-binding protein|nr:ABC transporter substrate-binding protein [Rhodocyclaceae bacterium]MCA3109715.1 ABC transporter substrate-binding protein [Rhodocyclaceae bacterium]MCA3113691.1 ABC transporter substrate-binding protein [Rhodocyclaceae bacterium]